MLGVECSTEVIANVYSVSVLLAALARHTIVASATIKPVPGQMKGEGRALVDNS